MHPTGYPVQPAPLKVNRQVPNVTLTAGSVAAIIGGSSALAKNIRKVKQEEITREEAVKDTLREAAGAGLATAAGAAAVGAVGASGWFSLLGFFTAATGVKYLLNSATAQEAPAAPAPRKTKAKS